ncbi:hypothetical protein ciss_22810 [Carboxydothermus islandicus]|uniref:Uncharacterized protein n=1 Tax=Carboxydothermus islandicus TaxID=661089 RepID=A0A1L8D5B3_9THEO|nr:HD domain-containing phosphohydrolase [Carboxydothermus islandicus]GAV26348.1 hypothetical protein ciss_22810 [Carboxydothermus islandicus]
MYTVDLTDVVVALTKALEFTKGDFAHHHERVAYIAASIGNKLKLPAKDYETLFWAAYLHDLGAGARLMNLDDISLLDKYDSKHAELGYELLKDVPFFREVAEVIKLHHRRFMDYPLEDRYKTVSLLSQIIFAADQIELLLAPRKLALLQRREIERYFSKNTKILFNDLIVEAFLELSKQESFWIDLSHYYIEERLSELRPKTKIMAGEKELKLLSVPFAYIIDAKSHFTKTHSLNVAVLSGQLAETAGLTEQRALIEIAGLVHDIGKLGVPNKILEKNGPLTESEFAIIKAHPYFSYHLLNKVSGFEDIARWAGYHHEQPNGQGYPFKASGEQLCVPSRIIAVADKWVALTEKRPYRDALNTKDALEILTDMTAKEIVDRKIVNLLKENIDYFINNANLEIQNITEKEIGGKNPAVYQTKMR